MLEWSQTRLLVTLALAYFAILEPISWITAYSPPCIVEVKDYEQTTGYDHKKYCPTLYMGAELLFGRVEAWIEDHDKSIVAAFTIVIGVSTCLLWFATYKLWGATSAAAQHIQTVEGAWVFMGPWPMRGLHPRYQIFMKNYGKTPALVIEYHLEFSVEEPSGALRYAETPTAKPVVQMGGGDKWWPPGFEFERRADQTFALGFLRYLDAFDQEKTTRFCVDLNTGGPAGSPVYNSFRREYAEG
jgi:hypothetical protein